jgi:hypothetical protein
MVAMPDHCTDETTILSPTTVLCPVCHTARQLDLAPADAWRTCRSCGYSTTITNWRTTHVTVDRIIPPDDGLPAIPASQLRLFRLIYKAAADVTGDDEEAARIATAATQAIVTAFAKEVARRPLRTAPEEDGAERDERENDDRIRPLGHARPPLAVPISVGLICGQPALAGL